jgi:hypothetical protein
MKRRLLVGAAVTVAVLAGAIPVVAGASTAGNKGGAGKVGKNQYFTASVNGQSGINSPAVITVACLGPLTPGETGHPLAGQTLEVTRSPAVSVTDLGFTAAHGKQISVFFGAPPPVSGAGTSGVVTFTKYGVSQAIPTSLTVPCSGSGTISFVPLPITPPTSRDATVPVVYGNVAASPLTATTP